MKHTITITCESAAQAAQIVKAVAEAEENGEIDGAFNTKVDSTENTQ